MEKIIEVQNLKKSYGNIEAVKGIDFYVEQGSLFAFLGTNGAGKSTTIDMLSTQLKPDAGSIAINGHILGKDDAAIRNDIGIVFQDSVLDDLLTVEENLLLRGGLYVSSKAELKEAVQRAVDITDAKDFLKQRYGTLSGGQRRRADIARALVNTPRILFLDEPTTGLDPQTRQSVWQTIQALQKSTGMTVFLTTHYMEEAAEADYITIIKQGEISAKGTPLQLKETYAKDVIKIKPANEENFLKFAQDKKLVFDKRNGVYIMELSKTKDAVKIINELESQIESFEVLHGSMDDVFIKISNGEGK